MNTSTISNTINHTEYKSAKRSREKSDYNFEDYLKRQNSNNHRQETPKADGEITLVYETPFDKAEVIDITTLIEQHRQYKENIDGNMPELANFDDLKPYNKFENQYEWLLNQTYNPNNFIGANLADKENQARLARIGILNCMKYFDFTNADKFNELKANADYTGMSDTEKYNAIYDRYKFCYGEDFLSAFAVNYTSIPAVGTSDDIFRNVLKTFTDELKSTFGDLDEATKVCRAAQFGDMSDSEIRQAIKGKYPPPGEMTVRDLYFMIDEMRRVGVDGEVGRIMTDVIYNTPTFDFLSTNFIDKREILLDLPVDSSFINAAWEKYNGLVKFNIPLNPNFGEAMKDIFPPISRGVDLGVKWKI